ncbi:hypothetical protein ACIBI7_42640 [Nonomuraea fuscirosea]|uniref:hypothetical protein n=1 Tax=Nonomuraea fuscirosea TaxID=1291556 RepID=UPI0037B88308
MTGIEVCDLTMTYSRITAVDQLSFTVRPGLPAAGPLRELAGDRLSFEQLFLHLTGEQMTA